MSIGQRLKKARYDAGLTLRQTEAITGVSFSSLARIERDQGAAMPSTISRVEKWLKDGEGSEPRHRGLSCFQTLELRVLHLEGIVTGLLNRLERPGK